MEEQFYLLWPGLFFLFRNRLGALAKILLVTIPCIWVLRIAMHLHGVHESYIYTSFETRADALLAGSLMAIVPRTGMGARFVERLRSRWALTLVLGLLLVSPIIEPLLKRDAFLWYRNIVGFTVDPVLLAMLMVQVAGMRGADWMDSRPISYLGRISYSTYLYQELVVSGLAGHLNPLASAPVCLVLSWGVAAISFECVEKPFLRLKRRFEAVRVEDAMGNPVTGEA